MTAADEIPETSKDGHITIVTKRRDRRIGASPGQRFNLCGAEPTDRDWLYAEAKRAKPGVLRDWRVCQSCVDKLPAKTVTKKKSKKPAVATCKKCDGSKVVDCPSCGSCPPEHYPCAECGASLDNGKYAEVACSCQTSEEE